MKADSAAAGAHGVRMMRLAMQSLQLPAQLITSLRHPYSRASRGITQAAWHAAPPPHQTTRPHCPSPTKLL